MSGNRQRRFSGTGALTYIGVGVLIVAAAAAAGFALTKNNNSALANIAASYTPPTLPDSARGASPSSTPTPTAAPSETPTVAPTGSAPASATPPRVVFLGDGYASADGATDDAHGFPALVGQAEKWDVDVVSCEVAGYVKTGLCGSDYAGLIPKVVADQPSIVVVTGGRNDVAQASASASAATAFFTQLSAALPGATVYAVSPLWDDDHAQAPLGVVQQSVQAAATASGAAYLDIGEPLRDHPELVTSDGILPNDAGNAAIAAAIEAALPAGAQSAER